MTPQNCQVRVIKGAQKPTLSLSRYCSFPMFFPHWTMFRHLHAKLDIHVENPPNMCSPATHLLSAILFNWFKIICTSACGDRFEGPRLPWGPSALFDLKSFREAKKRRSFALPPAFGSFVDLCGISVWPGPKRMPR